MKKIVLGLVLSATVAAQIPAAAAPRAAIGVDAENPGLEPAPVQEDAQPLKANTRRPIPFKPFPVADLRTGQPISPDTIIQLKRGKRMKAGEFFAQLNDLERQFNALGHSLRQPGVFKLGTLEVDQQELQVQKVMLHSLPPASVATQTVAPITSTFHTTGITPKVVRVVPISGVFTPTGASTSKTWNQSFGNRDSVGASLNGELNVTGSGQGVNASGVARASGAILGKEWDLIRVTGNMNAPKAGGGTVKVNLYVVGVGDSSFTSLTGNVNRQLDVSEKFPFTIGPFPMSARVGVRGSAGVQYGVALKPAGVNVSLTPKLRVSAYGQGGLDLGIAEGGVGAELTLLNNTLQLAVEGELVTVAGRSAMRTRTYGAGNVNALSGRLYAYAKVDVWLWEDEWQYDIWKFDGFKKDYTLFDESKTILFANEQAVKTANQAVLAAN